MQPNNDFSEKYVNFLFNLRKSYGCVKEGKAGEASEIQSSLRESMLVHQIGWEREK